MSRRGLSLLLTLLLCACGAQPDGSTFPPPPGTPLPLPTPRVYRYEDPEEGVVCYTWSNDLECFGPEELDNE